MDSLTALDHYYNKQDVAMRECLLALKSIILSLDEHIVPKRKYQIPFFTYKDYTLGFLWVHRKRIIVGFVEDRKWKARSSALPTVPKKDSVYTIEVNPLADIPIEIIKENYRSLINRYQHENKPAQK